MAYNFKKGMEKPPGSGRKRGQVTKLTEEVRKLARKHAPDAIEKLAEIIKADDVDPRAKVQAAQVLLDRAYGKASPVPTNDDGSMQAFKVVIMGDDAKL